MTEKLMHDFRLPSTKRRLIQTSGYRDCNCDCNREHDRPSLIPVLVGEYAGAFAGAHTRAHSRMFSYSLLLPDLARLYILSV
jgi:hypothetical protein